MYLYSLSHHIHSGLNLQKKVVQFWEAALLSFDVIITLKTCTYISIYSKLKYFFALLIIPFVAHYVLLYIYGSKQFPKEILA